MVLGPRPPKTGAVLLSLGFRQCYGRVVSGAEKFAARRLYAIALSLSGMWRVFYRLVICPGSVVATYCVPVGGIQLPLTSPLIKPARLPARHPHTHDLFVEAFGTNIELKGTKHLCHPYGLRLARCAGAYPPSATVDQPVLPALLESVPQAKEIAFAEPKTLIRLNTT